MTGPAGSAAPGRWARDPLLAAVRVLVTVLIAATAVGALALALSVPTMPLWWGVVGPKLARHAGTALPTTMPYMIAAVVALVAAIALLASLFLLLPSP